MEVNGTNQTQWLNKINTSYQPNQISLGARHPTIHEISIQLDNITIIQHSNTEPMEVNGTNQTQWLNKINTSYQPNQNSLGARHPTVCVANKFTIYIYQHIQSLSTYHQFL